MTKIPVDRPIQAPPAAQRVNHAKNKRKNQMITLTGIQSLQAPEDRALAYIEVNVNNEKYEWQVYIPTGTENLQAYLDQIEPTVIADITAKEIEWQALEPETRTITDPFGNTQTVAIDRTEIVKPTIPDYYALRRNEYPTIGDQLDAMWKGTDSAEYAAIMQKIQAVKDRYPKN